MMYNEDRYLVLGRSVCCAAFAYGGVVVHVHDSQPEAS